MSINEKVKQLKSNLTSKVECVKCLLSSLFSFLLSVVMEIVSIFSVEESEKQYLKQRLVEEDNQKRLMTYSFKRWKGFWSWNENNEVLEGNLLNQIKWYTIIREIRRIGRYSSEMLEWEAPIYIINEMEDRFHSNLRIEKKMLNKRSTSIALPFSFLVLTNEIINVIVNERKQINEEELIKLFTNVTATYY